MTKQTDRCSGGVGVSGRRGVPGGHHVDVLTLGELELNAFEFAFFFIYVCRNFTLKKKRYFKEEELPSLVS